MIQDLFLFLFYFIFIRIDQVSLRGASAKEITRDALLEKVSQERELRNYTRRATAAAIFIQVYFFNSVNWLFFLHAVKILSWKSNLLALQSLLTLISFLILKDKKGYLSWVVVACPIPFKLFLRKTNHQFGKMRKITHPKFDISS